MAATDELLVVHTKDWVVAVQEVGMEHNFDAVRRVVEQLNTPDLVQDRVIVVVGHVVCRHGRERVALEGKDSTFEENLILVGQEGIWRGECRVLAERDWKYQGGNVL